MILVELYMLWWMHMGKFIIYMYIHLCNLCTALSSIDAFADVCPSLLTLCFALLNADMIRFDITVVMELVQTFIVRHL